MDGQVSLMMKALEMETNAQGKGKKREGIAGRIVLHLQSIMMIENGTIR